MITEDREREQKYQLKVFLGKEETPFLLREKREGREAGWM